MKLKKGVLWENGIRGEVPSCRSLYLGREMLTVVGYPHVDCFIPVVRYSPPNAGTRRSFFHLFFDFHSTILCFRLYLNFNANPDQSPSKDP